MYFMTDNGPRLDIKAFHASNPRMDLVVFENECRDALDDAVVQELNSWPGSAIVISSRAGLLEHTIDTRRACSRVHLLDPFETDSSCFNPLEHIQRVALEQNKGVVSTLHHFVQTLDEIASYMKPDPNLFVRHQGRRLVQMLVCYAIEARKGGLSECYEDLKTLGEVLDDIEAGLPGEEGILSSWALDCAHEWDLVAGPDLGPRIIDYAEWILEGWGNPMFSRMSQKGDFTLEELVGEDEPTTLYMTPPNVLEGEHTWGSHPHPIASLVMGMLTHELESAPLSSTCAPFPTLVIHDGYQHSSMQAPLFIPARLGDPHKRLLSIFVAPGRLENDAALARFAQVKSSPARG